MKIALTTQQKQEQDTFTAFVREHVIPYADIYDQKEYTPPDLIRKIAREGYLGAIAPKEYGGLGLDMLTFGLLHEEFGRGCSSLRSLLTVHSMVIHALLRWGNKQQKMRWLPPLAAGELIAAFSLSEPAAGSDAKSIETTATPHDNGYILKGHKKWMTYGQIASLFLVFAQCNGTISAFLVERNTPGLSIQPVTGLLGTRASMLAELSLDECHVPKENRIGERGFGPSAVVTSCLDIGRYSVACGCVGIAQACLDASLHYTSQRKQFDVYLKDHQLVQSMITNMVTNTQAARLLCYQAGYQKDIGDPSTIMSTWIAKYFASVIANNTARDAVQIHGANGCTSDYPVQRYLRDAKIMEIIEGSTQIQQITIAKNSYAAQ